VDESTSPWKGNTGGAGLVPHLSYVERKPEPLGVELKKVCDCSKGSCTLVSLTLTPSPVPKHGPLTLLFVFPPRCYAIPRDTGRKGKNDKTEIRRWERQRHNPNAYPKAYPAPTLHRTPKPYPHTNPTPITQTSTRQHQPAQ
jgi:hypothetical protein